MRRSCCRIKRIYFPGLLILGFCLGCSGSDMVSVTGKVLLDGELLSSGRIYFTPKDSGLAARGKIDSSGKFKMKTGQSFGVQPGTYLVYFDNRSTASYGEEENIDKPVENETDEIKLASKYMSAGTSGIEVTIESSGKNEFTWELTSE